MFCHVQTCVPELTDPSVNPLYYVMFTTCTLVASFLLFQGFNTTEAVNTISLLCGFLIIFSGVYLLNLSREDPDGQNALGNRLSDAAPTDAISGSYTRRSMQARRSTEAGFRSPFIGQSRRSSMGDRRALMQDYDVEQQVELGDLAEDSEGSSSGKRTSFEESTRLQNGIANGSANGSGARGKSKEVSPKG